MTALLPPGVDAIALSVFVACFAAVTVLGLAASRWRRPASIAHLDEWGLGGRGFGTWVTWFLIGGDFYTAYTVIAVPALVYATGGYGFFALPYAVLIYPIMYAVVPRLWQAARDGGHITAADVVRARWGSRPLELAVAATGIVATMPYIALQLVGMQVAIRAIGLTGEWPLIAAFAVLAIYTWTAGLRAPALIAFAKDGMIYIVVIAAVVAIPWRLHGWGSVFAAAGGAYPHAGTLLLPPGQALPYASLALGSACAAYLYPHTLTGVFAAASGDTLRRNAMLLPAYTLLLGLIALLGIVARAAHIHATGNDVVPALIHAMFPSWFAGLAYAAIAIGALVPAAVMSIGAANLFTRNLLAPADPAAQARSARAASLVVKAGALAAILLLPTQYAIDLQLLGGVWILQTLPAVVLGLWRAPTGRLGAAGLLAGWLAGMALGTGLAVADGLKPVHRMAIAGHGLGIYVGLLALALNLAVALAIGARKFALQSWRQTF